MYYASQIFGVYFVLFQATSTFSADCLIKTIICCVQIGRVLKRFFKNCISAYVNCIFYTNSLLYICRVIVPSLKYCAM
ncbi:uncharacterized protein NEPG_00644 [Nematocida parisii ERTm1]|uniref:uncharacterized protein n=1 Tax=Nematocida parisii (strain ERTm1 / ATCC PRA-289) TaxID=881290 RepID=UPI000264B806|nr:uncharacterized protein NEPG_00644 [Nematocida parisii ERTm1]EIJ95119.1 hypothetical protein NEPG_00644 [Nematocida parisii ERTm1]|eukprot:XP_013058475.1 hypothetical protein NEPG_00644 [Nematocida parisii ERTm1]